MIIKPNSYEEVTKNIHNEEDENGVYGNIANCADYVDYANEWCSVGKLYISLKLLSLPSPS